MARIHSKTKRAHKSSPSSRKVVASRRGLKSKVTTPKSKARPAPRHGSKPARGLDREKKAAVTGLRGPRGTGSPPNPKVLKSIDPGRLPKLPEKNVKPLKAVTRKIPHAELQRIRDLLARKRLAITNHLETELTELEKPEKRHRTDLEEIASDTHDTDSLCEIMGIESNQIGQIEMALNKIDNGTYGVCEDCGGEIPIARLEALPFATQCIECKRKAEIEGQISSAADSAKSQ